MNELVSVVVPVYKVEPYLERCIHSIIGQTYDNLEIILVDDGSPDRCGAICDRFAQEAPRIKVYHKTNGGLSDARNYGVERANGKYLAFVDSDDYISPQYIAYLYDLLVKYDADISCCCMDMATEDVSAFGTNPSVPQVGLFTGKEACRELLGGLHGVLVTAWGKLYKSEIVKKYPFPVGRKHEDEATTCKYYYAANRVAVGNRCLYAYYQNPNSIMHNRPTSINTDIIWAFGHRAEFFEEQGETLLAKASWDRLFYYCLYDSLENTGRCDQFLRDLAGRKRLSGRTQLELKLYTISPQLFVQYLKLIIYPLGKVKEKVKYISQRKIT